MEIAAAVEDGAQKLPTGEVSELRGKVCSILKNAKPPKANVTNQQLKSLKDLDNKVILPADKGNATVVIEKDQY